MFQKLKPLLCIHYLMIICVFVIHLKNFSSKLFLKNSDESSSWDKLSLGDFEEEGDDIVSVKSESLSTESSHSDPYVVYGFQGQVWDNRRYRGRGFLGRGRSGWRQD